MKAPLSKVEPPSLKVAKVKNIPGPPTKRRSMPVPKKPELTKVPEPS